MRKVFEAITERLQAFLGQRDNAAMIVSCSDVDCITILKLLEGLDDASSSEFFWSYPGDFIDAANYADAVVKDFLVKHDGIRLAMEHKKMKPWPPLPAHIANGSLLPSERLRELMAFSRSLLPEPEGCLAVWVLFPLHIADPIAYAQLVRELLRHQYPFPWFHHIRLILREDLVQPGLSSGLANAAQVEQYSPDLSEEAMEKAIEEEAADESLPLADRIQAMFISAQRDFSYSRFDEALKKHEIFLRYHSATADNAMVALALNSVGEIHQRLGRTEQAGRCFEAALEPACTGENPPLPVLFNTLLNLANLRMGQGRFAEAEAYYDAGEKLASVQRNPSAKVQSIENLGYCQYMQGKFADAAASWEHGATIAGKLEQPELQKSLLMRLREHYAKSNQAAQLRQIDAQLMTIKAA